MLTSIEQDIISLAGNHQPQSSHYSHKYFLYYYFILTISKSYYIIHIIIKYLNIK
jgi:hypothetical protein